MKMAKSVMNNSAIVAQVPPKLERSQFLALVAHELRNPLLPILNAAALLRRRPADAALVQASAAMITRQAQVMSRLIDDLLSAAGIQTGQFSLQRCQVSMSEVIRQCIETVGPFVAESGHRLIVDVSADPMEMEADAARLCQAVQNLIVNAAKYSDRGAEISISAARQDGEAVVRISDTGIGIDAGELDSIFGMYSQAGQGQSARSHGGLGLGLYLARALIEAHGGSLTATSGGRGHGSEFTLRVPCLAFDVSAAALAPCRPAIRSFPYLVAA